MSAEQTKQIIDTLSAVLGGALLFFLQRMFTQLKKTDTGEHRKVSEQVSKALVDQIAELQAEINQKDRTAADKDREIAGLQETLVTAQTTIQLLQARLKIYESD